MSDVVSLVGLAMMAGGMVALVLRGQLLSSSVPAIVLQASAIALLAWARVTFGSRSFHATASPTEGGLVTAGPYRWVRHPIYTAVALFGWGCWVGHPSWFSLGMACVVTAGGAARMLAEEALLKVRYPEYEEYARRTKRMVPHVF